jgi:hypothetical protein
MTPRTESADGRSELQLDWRTDVELGERRAENAANRPAFADLSARMTVGASTVGLKCAYSRCKQFRPLTSSSRLGHLTHQ